MHRDFPIGELALELGVAVPAFETVIDPNGLGGDFDGVATVPVGLEDVSCYPALFDALRARHWSSGDLEALAYGNVSRVLHDAEAVARRLRDERRPSVATLAGLDGPRPAASGPVQP